MKDIALEKEKELRTSTIIVKLHDMRSLLSSVHHRIAEAILSIEQRQEPAFVSDLVRRLGYAAESSLTATLRVMERNGFLVIQGGGERGRSRVVKLTAKARFVLGAGGIPLLGAIPAGPLEEALAQADEVLEPANLLPYRDGDFLLRVHGDSMIGDGILDGDWVLLRPNLAVQHGEIAAVLVGETHETTLKRVLLVPEKAEIILRASNPRYRDLVAKAAEVKVAGVFRGLIRHASA
ncbi:MAG TPA: S24 family peptidase [Terrimicrobiaceae bacterium]